MEAEEDVKIEVVELEEVEVKICLITLRDEQPFNNSLI